MKYTRDGIDSRDWWYDKELKNAVEHLGNADRIGRVKECIRAAKAFGRGLHSKQDKSSHRAYPVVPGDPPNSDWPSAINHPGWWDDWYGDEDSAHHFSELWWVRIYSVVKNPDYAPWGKPDDVKSAQFASQQAARDQVEAESKDAISDFVRLVRSSCACRRIMLRDQP